MTVSLSRSLPAWLHDAEGGRQVDALARTALPAGSAPGTLMARAGAAAAGLVRRRFAGARRILVCCGGGDNGGDGYVLARLLHEQGLQVACLGLVPTAQLRGDAAVMAAQAAGVPRVALEALPDALDRCHLVVDALLGTGLQRPVTGAWAQVLTRIQSSGRPVLALDLPSGLCADTGQPRGQALRATVTVSFITLKPGLLTGEGPEWAGELWHADLDVPGALCRQVPARALRREPADLAALLPRRARDSHKGRHGHALLVGGNHGMGGAILLSAEACARAGAGLTSVATRAEHVAPLLVRRPEVMAHGLEGDDLQEALCRATVVALGPGLGQDRWARALWQQLLEQERPLVLDADALNLLAAAPRPLPPETVLTPHPGEAARLLGVATASVQADRLAALAALVERYRCVVLLKGAGTLVGAPGQVPCLLQCGNPGMGTGGMGDVLTGVIVALRAQGLSGFLAAVAGGLAHGAAADRVAARQGERGLLATDVAAALPAVMNPTP